jgi:hypothetical protein
MSRGFRAKLAPGASEVRAMCKADAIEPEKVAVRPGERASLTIPLP